MAICHFFYPLGIQRPLFNVTYQWTACIWELGPSRSRKVSHTYCSSLSSPRVGSLPDTGFFLVLMEQLSQHVLENAAMAEILRLLGRVETNPG